MKKSAFTIAEVLVTLGVIGVVAAMTLPMLAENYQRIVVETRLKKFYTTFNQAILRSVEVNGPYAGWWYILENKYDANGNCISRQDEVSNNFEFFLAPYLNIVLRRKIIYTNGKTNTLYYLADGSAFDYPMEHNRDIRYYPKAPEKCLKEPAANRNGFCCYVFNFYPSNNKNISKYWIHHKDKGLEPYKYAWDGNVESLYTDKTYGCGTSVSRAYCTAIIQYNGWHFPEDYPLQVRY